MRFVLVLNFTALPTAWYMWRFCKEVVVAKVRVTLRPTVSRPVRLGVRRPSGTRDKFLFLLEIFFRHLRVCYFVAPSLTRGRVCNLLLLLLLESVVPLGSALSDERSGLSFVSQYVHKIFTLSVFDTRPQRRSTFFYITYINSVRTSQETQYISVM
jgi:hypothetical protein